MNMGESRVREKSKLIAASEETLLGAFGWANECFIKRVALTKDESILLERIVSSATQLAISEQHKN